MVYVSLEAIDFLRDEKLESQNVKVNRGVWELHSTKCSTEATIFLCKIVESPWVILL